RAPIGRRAAVVDQRLADVEPGGEIPELEAGGDVRATQVVDGVGDRAPRQERDHRAQQRLIGEGPDARIVEQRDLGPLARRNRRHGCPPSAYSPAGRRPAGSAVAHRIGGAYWIPPLVHSALRPRWILSGEP